MASNVGYQQVTVKYFDPVDSIVANRVGAGVRKTGIYSGGYITRVTDTSATVSALDCEIASYDGSGQQVRVQTGIGGSGTVTVTGLSAGVPYVVLKWVATTSPSTDYVTFAAETAANVLNASNSSWLIVGKCSFPGGTLTPGYGWDSTDSIITRSNPSIQDLFLKVEPTVAASMYVRIRGGRMAYGNVCYDVADQASPLLVAPGSNSWIVAIQVNTSGAIIATYGAAGAVPTAPDYGGLVTLAEIKIPSGTSSITASMIKDTRVFLGGSFPQSVNAAIITNLPGLTVGAGVIPSANLPTGSWLTIPATAGNAYKFLRVNAAGTALEYSAPTYA